MLCEPHAQIMIQTVLYGTYSSVSNVLSVRLYANLQDSHLEQDMHKVFTQFYTLGVHNVPAPQALAFFSSIRPKTQCMASIIDR